MSYTPINWQTGEIITADKLNKMDNGWRVVLSDYETVFDSDDESGGGPTPKSTRSTKAVTRDVGELFYIEITDEEAVARLASSANLRVTFNGDEYVCEAHDYDGVVLFGAEPMLQELGGGEGGGVVIKSGEVNNTPFATPQYDFSTYPFSITVWPSEGAVFISESEPESLVIESQTKTIETSEEFRSAVALMANPGKTTFEEVQNAFYEGRPVYIILPFINGDGYGRFVVTYVSYPEYEDEDEGGGHKINARSASFVAISALSLICGADSSTELFGLWEGTSYNVIGAPTAIGEKTIAMQGTVDPQN